MEKQDHVRRREPPAFQPEPLSDDWSKWLAGVWKVSGQTEWVVGDLKDVDIPAIEDSGSGWANIELDLNGQFLIIKSEGKIPEMDDEQIQNLKESTEAPDEEIKRFVRSLQLFTIDPKTGEWIGFLFDSLRSMAKGRGMIDQNKQIMEWEWYGLGHGVKSIQIRERVGIDRLLITEEFTLPDDKVMKEITVMTKMKETAKPKS